MTESPEGIQWRNIAEASYGKYRQSIIVHALGATAVSTPPQWADLPMPIQDAWVQATVEACHLFGIAVTA